MPRITAKTNVFLNREKKYRMTLEFKEAIELIPCEKGSFVMADFEDEAFMLFGDEAASDPCAAIEVAVIQDAFDKYDNTHRSHRKSARTSARGTPCPRRP